MLSGDAQESFIAAARLCEEGSQLVRRGDSVPNAPSDGSQPAFDLLRVPPPAFLSDGGSSSIGTLFEKDARGLVTG